MKCPKCGYWKMTKARLDVYWCEDCKQSWLIHKLSYESFEEASEVPNKAAFRKLVGHYNNGDKISFPPKPR